MPRAKGKAGKPGGLGKRKYQLTPLMSEFISAFAELNNVRKAAEKTGVPYPTALEWKKHPAVKAELKKITDKIAEKTGRKIEDAIAEMDSAAEFSRRTDNANALVRALEHKHKLEGFITDGKDPFGLGSAQFNLQIVGVRPNEQAEPVEVQVVDDAPALPAVTRDVDDDDTSELEELF